MGTRKLIVEAMKPRHKKELYDLLERQDKERRNYVDLTLAAAENVDISQVQEQTAAKFDSKHQDDIVQLQKDQLAEMKRGYLLLFPDDDLEDLKNWKPEKGDKKMAVRQEAVVDVEELMRQQQAELKRRAAEGKKRKQEEKLALENIIREAEAVRLRRQQEAAEAKSKEVMKAFHQTQEQYDTAERALKKSQQDRLRAALKRKKELKRALKARKRKEGKGGDYDDDKPRRRRRRARFADSDGSDLEDDIDDEHKGIISGKLAKLEEMVLALSQQANTYRDNIYVDELDLKDPSYLPDPALKHPRVVKMDSLSPSQFVGYRFGVALIAALTNNGRVKVPVVGHQSGPEKPVTLAMASELPPNPHQQIAFRNSWYFVPEEYTLYIRIQRLENLGGFVLVLVHALAHLGSSANITEYDDRNPAFVRSFLMVLRTLCSDLVHSRATAPLLLASQDRKEKTKDPDLSSLVTEVREVVVDNMIDLVPTSEPQAALGHDAHFAREKLLRRLGQYEFFHHKSNLGARLFSLEKEMADKQSSTEAKERKAYVNRQLQEKSNAPVVFTKSSGDVNMEMLEDISDKLQTQLLDIVEQLRVEGLASAGVRRRARAAAKAKSGEVKQFTTELKKKELLIRDLSIRKDVILQRLRQIDQAQTKLSSQ